MTVDFDKLRLILLPHALRQGGLIEALFRTAYVPLKRNYVLLTKYVSKEEQERQYGPTVAQLRRAIADHLGIGEDLIIFADVANRDLLNLRREKDAPSTHLKLTKDSVLTLWSDDMVWWNRGFTVSLPETYQANEPEVRTILERWKMASSQYTIKYYTKNE